MSDLSDMKLIENPVPCTCNKGTFAGISGEAVCTFSLDGVPFTIVYVDGMKEAFVTPSNCLEPI